MYFKIEMCLSFFPLLIGAGQFVSSVWNSGEL